MAQVTFSMRLSGVKWELVGNLRAGAAFSQPLFVLRETAADRRAALRADAGRSDAQPGIIEWNPSGNTLASVEAEKWLWRE
jgi:hypothetical protein